MYNELNLVIYISEEKLANANAQGLNKTGIFILF